MGPASSLRLVREAASGIEAVHARFTGHAYDLHRHEEWLVGVTEHGVQDFLCRRVRQRSTAGRVILIEPGEMHDGQAVTEDGFSYRMLYLPQDWFAQGLAQGLDPAAMRGLGFRATLAEDARLGPAIRRACLRLEEEAAMPRLAREAALDAVLLGLRGYFDMPAVANPLADVTVARRAAERLQDAIAEDIGADLLAREAGAADRFHLARAFRRLHGVSPHAYLVQIRLARARRLLAAGMPPAAVAADCGFADQSHLGRWFRRAYGLSPAAYRSGKTEATRTGVPDGSDGIG